VSPKTIIFLIAFLPLLAYSQQADAVLSKFFATPLNETVFLRWTITAGNTCSDTYVERSADGITYERIGLIGGICGSPDQSITYEFTDTLPLINRTSYYRLELGYFGYTSPQIVTFIRYNEQGFLLAPNPFSESARLIFENTDGDERKLQMIDMQGRVVRELVTTSDEFIIQRLDMNSGVYFFRVSYNGQVILKGKMIIS